MVYIWEEITAPEQREKETSQFHWTRTLFKAASSALSQMKNALVSVKQSFRQHWTIQMSSVCKQQWLITSGEPLSRVVFKEKLLCWPKSAEALGKYTKIWQLLGRGKENIIQKQSKIQTDSITLWTTETIYYKKFCWICSRLGRNSWMKYKIGCNIRMVLTTIHK